MLSYVLSVLKCVKMDIRMLGYLLLVCISMSLCDEEIEKYRADLFNRPGVIWIEETNGLILMQHIYLTSDLWKKAEFPKPHPLARASSNVSRFTHIDVDVENRTMVVVDSKRQKIVAYVFDSKGMPTYWVLYEATSKKVNGIAIDWVTDVVYWTDAAYDVILAVSMFSPNEAVAVVDTKLDEPYGIVAYPQEGFLFWTDIDERNPRLMRSTLSGRNIKRLVRFSSYATKAMSLFMDYEKKRLYWVYVSDSSSQQGISWCNIDGKNMDHLQKAVASNYFDIDIFANQLLYIEHAGVNVYNTERSNSGPVSRTKDGTPLTLMVVDKDRQFSKTNRCLQSDCPGVCTMSSYRVDCFCSEMLSSKVEPEVMEKHCGSAPTFDGLLLPKGDGIYSLKTNFIEIFQSKSSWSLTQAEPRKVLDSIFPIKAITSDVNSGKIFFYEYRSNMIKSILTVEDSVPEVVSLAVGEVGGLAFDIVSKHLYWTDNLYNHIMLVREDGQYPVVVHKNLDRPKAIAIHSIRRRLIWSEAGARKLMKSYLDGSSPTEIYIYLRYQITAITVDSKLDIMYLCDDMSIYETDIEGTYLLTHYYRKHKHMFTGLTIVHDYLVVTDTIFFNSGLHVFDRKTLDKNGKISKVGDKMYSGYEYGNWHGVHYHHTSNQIKGLDRCRIKRAKCDQLCLTGEEEYRCVCTIGYRLNGSSCVIDQPYKPFLLLVDKRYPALLQMHGVTHQFAAVPVQAHQQPYSVAYDPVNKMIYWSDLELGTISRAYSNGSNQEVIKHNPDEYYLGLTIEPGSRTLFYVIRSRDVYDYRPVGSLAVMDIDSRKGVLLMDRQLLDPYSMAVNTKHGYIFMTERKHVWRFNMNQSESVIIAEFVNAKALTTSDDHVYFVNEVPGDLYFDPILTQIVRIGINGENVTLLLELSGGTVSDLAVDKYFIYWINGTTRGVQRANLEKPDVIEDFGPSKALFHPTGLYVSPAEEDFDSVCDGVSCSGICLPTPTAPLCEERVFNEILSVNNESELCVIPEIKYGVITDNVIGAVVPRGYKARVECFPAHNIVGSETITCKGGEWTDIPECRLGYEICGTPSKGYKAYKTSGLYFAYPEATKVGVICIGAGGGGYDVMDEEIIAVGRAGDGGDSSFGSYLHAYGGKGGTKYEGGNGGHGHVSGGAGSAGTNCTTGGTACQAGQMKYSYELFCGSGAYSDECTSKSISRDRYAGPGGMDGNGSVAGLFGGGAGRRGGGGSGGGGGGSRLVFTLPEKEVVQVTVGQPGYPSYGYPAQGLVVVSWGDYPVDDYVQVHDVINDCVL